MPTQGVHAGVTLAAGDLGDRAVIGHCSRIARRWRAEVTGGGKQSGVTDVEFTTELVRAGS